MINTIIIRGCFAYVHVLNVTKSQCHGAMSRCQSQGLKSYTGADAFHG